MSDTLADQVLAGQRRAIARLITRIENEHPQAQTILSQLYPHTGRAHLIGVTGAPGTGKSTLVNELAKAFRRQERTVAILAIDPTSPFSGGAILGDRIRMQALAGDPGVFIRSMASRGSLGGLARATNDAIKVLDAADFEVILIETVGAGQGEVEIARTAQTIIVVEAPGLGDDIQAIKAGILEIADIFVVNKADRRGTDKTVASLTAMLELGQAPTRRVLHHGILMAVEAPLADDEIPRWEIPVIKTMALKGEGVEQVVEAITGHRQHLTETGELAARERARLAEELENRLQATLMKRLLARIPPDYLPEVVTKLVDRRIAPYNAVQMILEEYAP
jgi:LAO/AO transport system kinase